MGRRGKGIWRQNTHLPLLSAASLGEGEKEFLILFSVKPESVTICPSLSTVVPDALSMSVLRASRVKRSGWRSRQSNGMPSGSNLF